MACTPSKCTGNCYNDTCATYTPACGANTYSFGADPTVGDDIVAVHVNDLQDAIDNERTIRRGLAADFTGQNVVANVDSALKTDFDALRDSLNEIIALYSTSYNPAQVSPVSTITTTYLTSRAIEADDVIELRSACNDIREDCSCNTDCGKNKVCVCDGDCGCNYSDKRLKKEIEYL